MPKFIRGTLSSDFFASQLDAVDEVVIEKDQLRKTSSELKRLWQSTYAKMQNQTESESEICRLKFERDVKQVIEESFSAKQLSTLSKLAEERRLVLEARCRNFQFPFLFSAKHKPTGKQLEKLKQDFERISKTYEKKNTEAFAHCVKKLKDSGVLFEGFEELVKLHEDYEAIDNSSLSMRPEVTKEWGREEFDSYESEKKAVYLNNCHNHVLAPFLLLTQEQENKVAEMVHASRDLRDPNDFVDPNYSRKILAIKDDSLKDLQSKIREKLELQKKLEQKLSDEVASKILLPHQTEILDRLAKFSRDIYELRYGDEFGAVSAWIDIQAKVSRGKKDKMREDVANQRSDYHEEMRLLRATLCKEAVDCLPDDIKKGFLAKFGEQVYDVDAEKIARWEEIRTWRP